MSEVNEKDQSVIEKLFTSIIDKLDENKEGNCYNDLFVQIDAATGEVEVYDDTEKLLDKTIIFNWVNKQESNEEFKKESISVLKEGLADLVSKGVFEKSCILKPFSINLADESFDVLEELLFLDDENLRLDDPLLKDLDADLDDFLSKLLSDVE